MRSSLLVLIAGLALVGCDKDNSADSPAAPSEPSQPSAADPSLPTAAAGARRVAIEVRKTGYVPNTLAGKANEPIVLVFTRVDDTECGRFIKVKGTDIEAELPMNQPVEIPVTLPKSGELVFTCGMGMMHGIIAVNPPRG